MDAKLPSRIERLNYILGGLATAVGAFALSRPQVLGLLIGATISALNFSSLRWIGDRMRRVEPDKSAGFALLLVPQFLATMGAIAFAILVLPISGVFLGIGFSVFLVSILIETIRSATNPVEDDESA
jgi:hypothetical protein